MGQRPKKYNLDASEKHMAAAAPATHQMGNTFCAAVRDGNEFVLDVKNVKSIRESVQKKAKKQFLIIVCQHPIYLVLVCIHV